MREQTTFVVKGRRELREIKKKHPLICCPGLRLLNFFHAQLSLKFIMLINVKMPTIVGILTFISMINKTHESLEARKFFIF